jgi:c-di-AMP phosphodiesterase-like protein
LQVWPTHVLDKLQMAIITTTTKQKSSILTWLVGAVVVLEAPLDETLFYNYFNIAYIRYISANTNSTTMLNVYLGLPYAFNDISITN